MAGGVITAAWIQGICQGAPVAAAAFVAWLGLRNWRHEIRERRRVEAAEQCLLASREAITAIRAVRIRGMFAAEMAGGDQKSAVQNVIRRRLDRAWQAWQAFEGKYALAALYFSELPEEQEGAALDLRSSLVELDVSADIMFQYERAEDGRASPDLVAVRQRFFGPSPGENPDEVEERLRRSKTRLEGVLKPVLRPPV